MPDIELSYGPGGSVTVLVQSMKAFGSKAKLDVLVEAKSDELHDALRLEVCPGATPDTLARLQKWLPLCFSNFAKRDSELLFALDEARVITLNLPPPRNRQEHESGAIAFYRMAQRYLEADESERESLFGGAQWNDGRARLMLDEQAGQLQWVGAS